MASPGNIDSAEASVGDDTKIAAAATANTASNLASAVAPANTSEQLSTLQERLKPVSAETSFATSEAPSSNSANSANDEDDDEDDDGNNEIQDVGADNHHHHHHRGNTSSSKKKRKVVKRSREERLEMNRMTARERRRKAKVLVDTLQERVNELTRHNEAIRRDNTLIRAQLQALTAQNSQAASGNTPANANANAVNATSSIVSRGMAVSSSPSPSAAPVSASSIASLSSDDSSAVALLIRQLQQQKQQQQAPQMSSPANPSPGLQQIFQASSTANPTSAPAAVQAQIDQLRQQNALRMLGLQVPVPVQTAVSGILANGATNFAVPGSLALPNSAMGAPAAAAAAPSPSDLATSALSAYRQQQQPPQGMAPIAPPAQINLQQLVPNSVAATNVLQLALLEGTGALPASQAVGLAANNATANSNAALSSPGVAQVTTNASANIGNANVLAQLLPALLQQQQQQQQQDQSQSTKGPPFK